MRLADAERFDPRAVAWFYRLFGAAMVVNVATEARAGVWRVHTGELYPWRHLPFVPLLPPSGLVVEWTVTVLAGLALALGLRRAAAVRVAALAMLVSVLQRYSNHAALMLLVAAFVALSPPDVAEARFAARARPNMTLVRAQLAIVYVFSAANKLVHGFLDGQSLANLTGYAPRTAAALSVAVIVGELLLPPLLVTAPRAGIAAVAVLHVAFATQIPGVWSFTLTMIAMAALYVAPESGSESESESESESDSESESESAHRVHRGP